MANLLTRKKQKRNWTENEKMTSYLKQIIRIYVFISTVERAVFVVLWVCSNIFLNSQILLSAIWFGEYYKGGWVNYGWLGSLS